MLFAHQGGWDEALIVLAPMIVFFGRLFVANRRARLAEAEAGQDGDVVVDES